VLYTPKVSIAMGSNKYRPSMLEYLSSLWAAASSAAEPASRAAPAIIIINIIYRHYYYYLSLACFFLNSSKTVHPQDTSLQNLPGDNFGMGTSPTDSLPAHLNTSSPSPGHSWPDHHHHGGQPATVACRALIFPVRLITAA